MQAKNLVVAAGVLLLMCTLAFDSGAASVETFVLAVGGQSIVGPGFSCSTFGPASPALAFFINASVGVPTDGLAACNVAGDFRTTTDPVGPISDTESLAVVFGSEPNIFSGMAAASAEFGTVGAEAHGTFTGSFNAFIVEGTTSYGIVTDTLTATSPNVASSTPGTIRLRFDVDGGLSGNLTDLEINYSVAGGPSYLLMRAQIGSAGATPFATTGTGAPLSGFTSAPGSFAGMDTIGSLDLPFVWGAPFALRFGLMAVAQPGVGASADVDFAASATLSGIELLANGQPVKTWSLASESGTPYGVHGVNSVPEPAAPAASLAVILGMAIAAGRRRPR